MDLRAFIVSVNYTDLLSVTLPLNRHHFHSVTVVTSPADEPNLKQLCRDYETGLITTDLFYRDGADFNKWLALETALDFMGRKGWICLLDADILWPVEGIQECLSEFSPGHLYTPLRRMFDPPSWPPPHEKDWWKLPLHPNIREWAGYTQIFHSSDPVLGPPPWHETNWRHAGGADSIFQAKWSQHRKERPPFEVLHFGPAGVNWCGRASALLDGRMPADSAERAAKVKAYIRARRPGPDRFDHEKINPT